MNDRCNDAHDNDPLDAERHGRSSNASASNALGTSSCPLTISGQLWEGAALAEMPFHAAGPARRRFLRLRRIEDGGGDGCNVIDDGSSSSSSSSSYAFQTPPSMRKKRRRQVHSGSAGNSGVGMMNASKHNSVEVCVAPPGQSSSAIESSSTVHLASKPLCLEWFDPDGPSQMEDADASSTLGRRRFIHLEDIRDVTAGHATPAFRAHRIRHERSDAAGGGSSINSSAGLPDASLCFSIVTRQRTLDLAADSVHEARRWVEALNSLLEQCKVWDGGKSMTNNTPKRSRSNPRQRISSPISRLASSPDLHDSFTSIASSDDAAQWDPSRNHTVFHAARTGNLHSLAMHFDREGCPVDVMEESSGDTPLLLACRLGHASVVDQCLKRGAHNDPHPTYGQTALQAAVSSGHAACVKLLLETAEKSGADAIIANHEEIGATDPTRREAPIHTAARCGSLDIVELLVLHGANLGLVDSSGRTALHSAAAAGHSAVLKLLLDAGGEVFLGQMNDAGLTCLHLAIQNNRLDCVRALLEFAADVDERAMEMATARRLGKIVALLQAYCAVSASRSPGGDHDTLAECRDDGTESRRSSISTVTFDLPRPEISGPTSTRASCTDTLETAMEDYAGGIVRRRSTIGHTPTSRHQDTPNHYFTPASTPFGDHQDERRRPHQPQCAGSWASPASMLHPPVAPTSSVPATPSVIEAFQLGPQYWQTFHEPGSNMLFFVRHSDGHSQWEDPRIPPVSIQGKRNEAASNSASPPDVFRTPLSSPELVVPAPQAILSPLYPQCQNQPNSSEPAEQRADDGNGAPSNKKDLVSKTIATASGNQGEGNDLARSTSPVDPRKAMLAMIRARGNASANEVNERSNEKIRSSEHYESAEGDAGRSLEGVAKGEAPDEEETPDPRKTMLAMIKARSGCAAAPPAPSSGAKTETPPDPRKAMLAMIKARAPLKDKRSADAAPAVTKPSPSVVEKNQEVTGDTSMSDEKKDAINKYKRMLRMKVPAEAVRHEMRKQGHEEQRIVSAVFGSPDGSDASTRNSGNKSTGDDAAPLQATMIPTKEDTAKDPILAPYVKMVKVGVPILSALHKLTKEGVEEDKILYFKRAYGIDDRISACATKKRKAVNTLSSSLSILSPSSKRRPSKALQRIHWTTVTDESKLEGSLWASDVVGGLGEGLDDSDIRELEEVFADAPASTVGAATPATQRKAKKRFVSLIDPRRAQNVAIQLAQFKSFASDEDILSSLSSFTSEQLLILTSIIPSADELVTVKSYDGSISCLGRTEQFFMAVSVMPRLPSRLRAFLFMSQFNVLASELDMSFDSVSRACNEVVSSCQLKSMLRRLLLVGNAMNESAGRKKAIGISVDSIIKTATKRGRDNKTTVADHVVAKLLKHGDSDGAGVVEFASSIGSIDDAKNVDMKDAQATLRKMESGLEQLHRAIESEQKDENDCSSDLIEKGTQFVEHAQPRIETLKAKHNEAEQAIRMLYRYFAEDDNPKQSRLTLIMTTLSELRVIVEQSKEKWAAKQKMAKPKSSVGDTVLSTPAKRAAPSCIATTPASRSIPPPSNRESLLSAIKATKERKDMERDIPRPSPQIRATPDRSALLSAIQNRSDKALTPKSAMRMQGQDRNRNALLAAINLGRVE